MKYDPACATSPIFVTDKDYEFSVDPDITTLVESDPFHGYESETIVAHLTKPNDIATLFTNDEKTRYYYILKLFPFSLKGDAKAWFNSLDLGCVRSRLLGKGLLMVHRFCLLMAHYRCAISSTPLEFFTNGAPLVRH